MADGDFLRTPSRMDVSRELDYVAAHLDHENAVTSFEEYFTQTDELSVPTQVAALALKNCDGDYQQAMRSLQSGISS